MASEINLKYLHPSIKSYITTQDNNYDTSTTNEILFIADVFDHGRDNVIQTITTLDEYLFKYGEPNYAKFGQAGYNAERWLTNGGTVAIMRLLPDNASYAHAVLNIQCKNATNGKTVINSEGEETKINDVYLRPLATYIGVNNTSINLIESELAESRADYPTTDGYTDNFIFAVYPEGRGEFYNNLGFRIRLNNSYDTIMTSRVYTFEVVKYSTDGSFDIIEGPFYVSFDPDAIDPNSQRSMFIENVVNSYSNYIQIKFNTDNYIKVASIINDEVDPYIIDIITGQSRILENNEAETYFSSVTGKNEDVHISLQSYSSQGTLITNNGEIVLNISNNDEATSDIIDIADNARRVSYNNQYFITQYMRTFFNWLINDKINQNLNKILQGSIENNLHEITGILKDKAGNLIYNLLDNNDNTYSFAYGPKIIKDARGSWYTKAIESDINNIKNPSDISSDEADILANETIFSSTRFANTVTEDGYISNTDTHLVSYYNNFMKYFQYIANYDVINAEAFALTDTFLAYHNIESEDKQSIKSNVSVVPDGKKPLFRKLVSNGNKENFIALAPGNCTIASTTTGIDGAYDIENNLSDAGSTIVDIISPDSTEDNNRYRFVNAKNDARLVVYNDKANAYIDAVNANCGASPYRKTKFIDAHNNTTDTLYSKDNTLNAFYYDESVGYHRPIFDWTLYNASGIKDNNGSYIRILDSNGEATLVNPLTTMALVEYATGNVGYNFNVDTDRKFEGDSSNSLIFDNFLLYNIQGSTEEVIKYRTATATKESPVDGRLFKVCEYARLFNYKTGKEINISSILSTCPSATESDVADSIYRDVRFDIDGKAYESISIPKPYVLLTAGALLDILKLISKETTDENSNPFFYYLIQPTIPTNVVNSGVYADDFVNQSYASISTRSDVVRIELETFTASITNTLKYAKGYAYENNKGSLVLDKTLKDGIEFFKPLSGYYVMYVTPSITSNEVNVETVNLNASDDYKLSFIPISKINQTKYYIASENIRFDSSFNNYAKYNKLVQAINKVSSYAGLISKELDGKGKNEINNIQDINKLNSSDYSLTTIFNFLVGGFEAIVNNQGSITDYSNYASLKYLIKTINNKLDLRSTYLTMLNVHKNKILDLSTDLAKNNVSVILGDETLNFLYSTLDSTVSEINYLINNIILTVLNDTYNIQNLSSFRRADNNKIFATYFSKYVRVIIAYEKKEDPEHPGTMIDDLTKPIYGYKYITDDEAGTSEVNNGYIHFIVADPLGINTNYTKLGIDAETNLTTMHMTGIIPLLENHLIELIGQNHLGETRYPANGKQPLIDIYNNIIEGYTINGLDQGAYEDFYERLNNALNSLTSIHSILNAFINEKYITEIVDNLVGSLDLDSTTINYAGKNFTVNTLMDYYNQGLDEDLTQEMVLNLITNSVNPNVTSKVLPYEESSVHPIYLYPYFSMQDIKDSVSIARDNLSIIKSNILKQDRILTTLNTLCYDNLVQNINSAIGFAEGSDGDFTYDNSSSAKLKLRENKINDIRIKAYKGTWNSDVINKDIIEFDHILDANYEDAVKNAIITLARDERQDFFFWADTKIQNTVNDCINWKKQFTNQTYFMSITSQSEIWFDEYTTKNIELTSTYLIADLFPRHINNYGINLPMAGSRRGVVGGFRSISWYPNETQKETLYVNKVNYIERDMSVIRIGAQNTNYPTGPLGSINNVLITLKIKRQVEKIAKQYQFEYNNDATRNACNAEINSYLSKWIANGACTTAVASVYASDYDIVQKIMRVSITLKFTGVLERIVINIDCPAR